MPEEELVRDDVEYGKHLRCAIRPGTNAVFTSADTAAADEFLMAILTAMYDYYYIIRCDDGYDLYIFFFKTGEKLAFHQWRG